MNSEEERLLKKMSDMARRADASGRYLYSGFLSMAEQDLLLGHLRELPAAVTLYGGNDSCERRAAAFGNSSELGYEPCWPISVLEISPVSEKFGELLGHRDYLGAILNLGIDRSLTGDIIIREKHAWLYCLDSIAGFLTENLTTVRHTAVKCQTVEDPVPELEVKMISRSINVASERLDTVVAALVNISRSKSDELFREGRIYVNGRLMDSGSHCLKEGDILTIRGWGKAVYRGVEGHSRKDRLYVTVEVYG